MAVLGLHESIFAQGLIPTHGLFLARALSQAVYLAEGDIAAYDFDLWMAADIDSDGNIERYRKSIKNELRKAHRLH